MGTSAGQRVSFHKAPEQVIDWAFDGAVSRGRAVISGSQARGPSRYLHLNSEQSDRARKYAARASRPRVQCEEATERIPAGVPKTET